MQLTTLSLLFWLGFSSLRADDRPATPAPAFPPPTQLELKDECGRCVQRFMQRLESSTPRHRNTVRVLFYGQSITEQDWARQVGDDLRARYPNANLDLRNLAIGGFASDKLVQTAEADLYPFYPDLLIFYDYGRHDRYEDMIRRTRARTTAEILLQTDHLNSAANLDEETDPTKLTMQNWSSWFPNFWIPFLATKYHVGLLQQRALWKIYCRHYHLDPVSLTVDGAHLNDQGNYLMAKIVEAYLVRRPQDDDPTDAREVRDYFLGKDVKWTGHTLTFPFSGNRVDVIADPGRPGTADVRIDGLKPSQIPELYGTSRVSGFPGIGWPIISRIEHQAPLLLENWTTRATGFSADGKQFHFSVQGSVTGPDGEGTSDQLFVSKSGRVVIRPEAWNIDYSFGLLQGPWAKSKGNGPFVVPAQIVASWKVLPFFVDTYTSPKVADPSIETLVTLAQGLSNGPHVLTLTSAAGPVALQALRVYQPPLLAPGNDEDQAAPAEVRWVPTFAPPLINQAVKPSSR